MLEKRKQQRNVWLTTVFQKQTYLHFLVFIFSKHIRMKCKRIRTFSTNGKIRNEIHFYTWNDSKVFLLLDKNEKKIGKKRRENTLTFYVKLRKHKYFEKDNALAIAKSDKAKKKVSYTAICIYIQFKLYKTCYL